MPEVYRDASNLMVCILIRRERTWSEGNDSEPYQRPKRSERPLHEFRQPSQDRYQPASRRAPCCQGPISPKRHIVRLLRRNSEDVDIS